MAKKIPVENPFTPCIDDEGGGVRCLRFNSGIVQSVMHLSEPYALHLSYTRAIMGFLLFHEQPKHILIVGLGGGSLSKFCYRAFPHARITSVEISADVIALRKEFLIPDDDERFQIVHADAAEYLMRPEVQADVILLDGYDADGLPESLSSESFYARCWQVLGEQGVLAANLWGGERNRRQYIDRLRGIFDGRVWWSKPKESSSVVVYAVKNHLFYPQWSRLMTNAQALSQRLCLDLSWIVDSIRRCEDPDLEQAP
jgi:spermidine synthase